MCLNSILASHIPAPYKKIMNSISGGFKDGCSDWSSEGRNLNNSRYVNNCINKPEDDFLQTPELMIEINTSIIPPPVYFGNSMFVVGSDGTVRAYHRVTGSLIWLADINVEYFGNNVGGLKVSKTSPSIWARHNLIIYLSEPASIVMINMVDGSFACRLILDEHSASMITGGGSILGYFLYVGIASEGCETNYNCSYFIGSLVSVHLGTCSVHWRTPMIEKNKTDILGNFSGCPIYGPNPPINKRRDVIYVSTGNNFEIPPDYAQCLLNYSGTENIELCDSMIDYGNHCNSVLAINIRNGTIIWHQKFNAYKTWNLTCNEEFVGNNSLLNCPLYTTYDYQNHDLEFKMMPTYDTWCDCSQEHWDHDLDNCCEIDYIDYFNYDERFNCTEVIYISQVSGNLFAMNATDGNILWANASNPGGDKYQHSRGMAVDKYNIYINVYNSKYLNWTLLNNTNITGGGWIAHNKFNGTVQWILPNPAYYDPTGLPLDVSSNGRSTFSFGTGSPMIWRKRLFVSSGDVIFSPNISTGYPLYQDGGYVYMIDPKYGGIIDSYSTGSSNQASFSGNDKCVCIGEGREGHYSIYDYVMTGKYIRCWCDNKCIRELY